MEKTIQINGQDLELEAKAINLVIYKSQFGTDAMEILGQIADLSRGEIQMKDLDSVNLAKLVWTMAKTKNADIPNFDEWFAGLEAFPVIEIFNNIADLVSVNMVTISPIKPKNSKRAG